MAKRSRVASRPGQQRPARRPQRGASRPAPAAPTTQPARPSSGLTAEEEARAAALEAEIVEQDRPRGKPEKGRAPDPATVRANRTQSSGLLAARAAEEYDYVVRDLRRIGFVSGSLLIVMFVLYLLIEVLHVFRF
jgi:hypothetical protein